MAQVSLNSLTKIYPGGNVAVKDLNLGIENREFLVLLGPSGCGKSTTLRMVAGLESITEGKIFIGDKMVNNMPAKDRNIAMVFQNYALYPHMTVFENMAFGLKLRKIPRDEIKKRVYEAADILGITPLVARKPRELSGGERQRVALGRAIVRKPLVFLFDEPLSNLDAKRRVQMRTELHKLHLRLKTTMIYVTHDQVEAMTLGTRVAIMRNGELQQVDEPLEVYDNPVNKFVAGFIGNPPMNFIEGKVVKENSKFYFDEGTLVLKIIEDMYPRLQKYEGRDIVLGIRPEHIHDKLFVPDAPKNMSSRVKCEVVEPMGVETHIYLSTPRHSFVCRSSPDNKPAIGQELEIVFDMSKAKFFDKDTETSIV